MTVAVPTNHRTAQGIFMLSAREEMDIISAYREVGTYQHSTDASGFGQGPGVGAAFARKSAGVSLSVLLGAARCAPADAKRVHAGGGIEPTKSA